MFRLLRCHARAATRSPWLAHIPWTWVILALTGALSTPIEGTMDADAGHSRAISGRVAV